MTQQVELLKRIDTLPSKYFGEVIDFVGYLEHKARQETILQTAASDREMELINRHAAELGKEFDS